MEKEEIGNTTVIEKGIKADINKIEKVWYKNNFELIAIKLLLLQLEGDENVHRNRS